MNDQFENKLLSMASEEKMILPKGLENKVNYLLKQIPGENLKPKMNLRKALVLAAVLTMLFSITATATAGILKERMEAMNHKELEEYFVQIYTSRIPSDNYNRPFSEAEEKRMEELEISYLNQAHFPKKELTMLRQTTDYKGRGVAFYKDTSTFFFPEREMNDEELLQIIDFRYKRDYSLQKMNEKITAGEAEIPEKILNENEAVQETNKDILQSEVVYNPAEELTFYYTGDLEIQMIAAGQNCIFLTGWNAVHKMEIGNSNSTLFYNDFDKKTRITALCQDKSMNVYMGLAEMKNDETWDLSILILDGEGNYINKIDLSPYRKSNGMIYRMAVDENGYIYLRASGMKEESLLMVLDRDGNLISQIKSEEYTTHMLGCLGLGKDGAVYTLIIDKDNRLGIASVDMENQCLKEIYSGIVPKGTIMLDILSPGTDTDFVLWGYDGIFTYNLGEESAVNILPAWEAPCDYEGVCALALPDGRIVFADRTEYRVEKNEKGKEEIFAIPDKICFYYKSGMRGTK